MSFQAYSVDTITGAVVDRIPVSAFPWGKALSAGASGTSCSIPVDELAEYSAAQIESLTAHWKRTIVLERNGAVVFAGIVKDRDWQGRLLKLTLTDLWGLWARRGAWDHTVSNVEDWSVAYSSLSLGTLAKRAVQRGTTGAGTPSMALPITLPADVAGSNARTYYGYHLEYVADVLADLALEGVRIDFRPRWVSGALDWLMVTDPTPQLFEFHMNAPEGGVTGFRRTADGAKMTNNAIFVGEGSEKDMLVRSKVDATSSLPRLDRIESRKYVTSTSQLQALANEGAVVYGPATDQWKFDVLADGDPAVEDLRLGDTVRLWFAGDERMPDGYYDRRVVRIEGTLEQGVTVTCQSTVSSGGIDHSDARQELDRLQRRVKALETASPLNNTSVSGSITLPSYTFNGAGSDSTALGSGGSATGDEAVALGVGANAAGYGSTAIGAWAWALGERSLALGWNSYATGFQSAAIGPNVSSEDDYLMVIGTNLSRVQVPGFLNLMRGTVMPSGSADPIGEVGDLCADGGFLYMKTSGGWVRSAFASF